MRSIPFIAVVVLLIGIGIIGTVVVMIKHRITIVVVTDVAAAITVPVLFRIGHDFVENQGGPTGERNQCRHDQQEDRQSETLKPSSLWQIAHALLCFREAK